ncbi:MAG: SLBB domain-containing protein [Planctomycetes bacterium]|nr:SLBB domain-containing protein [Planctomycetota bacterium]
MSRSLSTQPVRIPLFSVGLLFAASISMHGCSQQPASANWLKNGLLDPSQTGNFEKQVRIEIRDSVSVLDEPLGIQDAEEPTEEDTMAYFIEPKIGPGDFIRTTIFELVAPGISSELQFQVSAGGFETFPVVGPIKVAGFSPRDLELEIKDRLRDGGILENADVQVTLLRSESQQYSIVGGVVQPGNYPLTRPNFRLLNAFAAAGGLPPQAETVIVIRNGAQNTISDAPPADSQMPAPESSLYQMNHQPISFTMSDVSRTGVAGEQPTATAPAGTSRGVNELEILEGGPGKSGEGKAPYYNPETGEWELADPGASPTTLQASDAAQPVGDVVFPENATPLSMPTTFDTAQESDPFDPNAFASSVRVLEIPAKALREGDPRYNIVIRPSDLIDVPIGEIGEFYMYGNLARPGAYQLTGRRITVKQAIASAGGFGPLAWPSRADLIRRVGKDEEQFIQIDLDAIFAGTAPDFYLRQNDIVNVGSSPISVFMAVLRNAFRFSYGFGFVYDRNFADSDSFGAKEQVKQRRNIERQQRGLPF